MKTTPAAKPPRHTYAEGWRYYPKPCAGHHAQGAAAVGFLNLGVALWSVEAILAGFAGSLFMVIFYIAYQGLSMIRKGDSGGLDCMDAYVGGALSLLVLAGQLAWRLFG